MNRRFCTVFLLLAALPGAGGCARQLASVSGSVSYRGKPVTSGSVIVKSADGERVASAPILPDGTFRLRRAPTGPVKVAVDNPAPPRSVPAHPGKNAPEADEVREAAEQARRFVALPPRYKDPDLSGITTTLQGGANTFDITLP
jgi:hypothetical protein